MKMWTIVETPNEVLEAYESAKKFELLTEDGSRFAWYDTREDAVAGLQELLDRTWDEMREMASGINVLERSLWALREARLALRPRNDERGTVDA